MDINPLLSMWFVDIFSYPIGCLLILLMVSFAVQKVFKSGIASLVFVFGVKLKRPKLGLKLVLLCQELGRAWTRDREQFSEKVRRVQAV